MNIFLWSWWGGYIFGNHLAVCCLHYLTHSPFSLCWLWERKKNKVENISEPGKWFWEHNSSFNWTTSNRSSLRIIFSPSMTSCVTKGVSSLKDGGKKSHKMKWDFFFKPELEGQFSALILLTFNETNQRQVTSLQKKSVFKKSRINKEILIDHFKSLTQEHHLLFCKVFLGLCSLQRLFNTLYFL